MRPLPKRAGALTRGGQERRALGFKPTQRFERMIGEGADKRDVAFAVAAPMGLHRMPFGTVEERMRAARAVAFPSGAAVGEQLGFRRIGRFDRERPFDRRRERLRHGNRSLRFGIGRVAA